jgi:N-acetylmuramoyl-L-alanine amidase
MTVNTSNAYSLVLQALCVWREARGESPDAQRAVLWSILNRAATSSWWNGNKAFDTTAVILFPLQYSSFNKGDANATKFPRSDDLVFQDILIMTIAPGPDMTNHATHYYSGDVVPSWAAEMTFTTQIGAFKFYKVAA